MLAGSTFANDQQAGSFGIFASLGLAALGGLVGVVIFCAVRRLPLKSMLDALATGAAVVASCAWLGCLMNGFAYGIETYPGQGLLWALSAELPDV